MRPQEIAAVRSRLAEFAVEMLGGVPRKDQRAAGELYVRGLLTDGPRKSMVPMAARLGTDHQRLQQFITSSTWDYATVRRNVARHFAASQPVEALVVDDTGFPKDGPASPCVARQYSGTLGKIGNCQIGVSVHLVNERASCAADWRLFCPQSWDDHAAADEAAAAGIRRRRERAAIPDEVRHTEKWRLALAMTDEMTGPGGWGLPGPATAAGAGRPGAGADAGYGDNTTFRLELEARGWPYVLAVKGTTSAYAGEGPAPQLRVLRPAGQPAPARDRQRRRHPAGDLAAGHQGHQGQPVRGHDQLVPGHPGAAGQPGHPPRPTAACQNAGCSPNGPPKPMSPRTTGYLPCPPPPRSPSSSAWPRSDGGSSTTTASSSTASASTTSKAGPSPAGTATSPSPPSPRPSAPPSGPTQKPLRRDDPLPGPARTADRARPHPRHLPPLPPALNTRQPRRSPRRNVTKYY